jgi:hypothetical protein
MRGQGPRKRSSKGKAPAKKSTQNEQVNRRVEDFLNSLETSEEDNCTICGKFPPDGLRLDLALRIVTSVQCELYGYI